MAQTDNTASSRTKESSQPSDHGQKFDIFLSHSGKQKNFVRQLYRDLTNQGVSCFFDRDRESLPVGEPFPPRIFEAVKTCKVAVLILSKDFLETKWPMLELSAFVEARDITRTNPNLKILPLFFLISPDALKATNEYEEKWKQLTISRETPAEWHRALKAIRPINGLKFTEGGDEVKFRDEIVKEIWHILPTPSPRYHVRCMQGEARMCQEVANFFNEVQPNKDGIRIAGLYAIAGNGKTTLGKAFCNFKLEEFEGKVCHLEFSRGDPIANIKLALQYLTQQPDSYVQTLTSQDQAKVELDRRVKGQRVLLVLDNITKESIDQVTNYLEADLGKDSWVLLSARSVDVLVNLFNIDKQSCMRVPRLKEEEAIAILLEKAFRGEPKLEAEDRRFALKCANRCFFKETSFDNGSRVRTFHPLALKAFGGYLKSKYGLNLSKWAAETDGMVDGAGDVLGEVFAVLDKSFDDMCDKHRTIFMLLTVYMLPNMSSRKVTEWLAINCNKETSFIEKGVEDLIKMAFIEEFKPEIRIHDLYIEFAQSKANEMKRWLWWNENDQYDPRRLIADDKAGFELAKLEKCMYRKIAPKYLGNLFVLQLVDVKNMSKLDLGPMDSLRSITLCDCKDLKALDGMEKLLDLAWLQIKGANPEFKLPKLKLLEELQHLEIVIAGSQVLDRLGDLTHCFRLREIIILCPSLLEFPRLKGMKHLEKVEFSLCDKVKGALDCRDCVKLQTIVLNLCCRMAASPLLTGCKKLSKLVLSECDAVTAWPDVDVPSALKRLELFISSKAASAPKNLESSYELKYLRLWNTGELMELQSFKRSSNLTVLKLGKCGIRELPDLTGCDRLEDVYFFQLKNLVRFPSFSSLRELKKLSLCNCISVQDPPDIEGCHKLQVFHLLYNDNMKGLPKMDKCAELEEIQVSWHAEYEVQYDGFNPNSCPVDKDLEFCLKHFKDEKFGKINNVSVPYALKQWEWLKGKTLLVKRYFRGVRLYYSLTAPYEDGPSKYCTKRIITLKMINGKVTPITTTDRDSQDRDWFNKVKGYFAAKKVNARASVSSGIGRMESRRGLFSRISHSIKELNNEAEYGRINFHNLVAPLKLLKPLLNHVHESKIAFTEAVIQSFEALDTVLSKAKELVMRYGPTCSRIYMAIHGPHFIVRFEEISLDISRILSALLLASLPISDQSFKQVERCIKDLRRVKYTFESYDERSKEDIENTLRDIRGGQTVCHSKIKIIADKLELMTNQEILREQCALEMEKEFVLAEKHEQEEECINRVIDLVTQMRECMLELKQTQSQYGPPIPADFRCPLSLELMADPVIIASGQTYERAYIQRWLDQGMKTCPKTRQALCHDCLIPNFTVKALIANWCESHDVPLPEPEKILFHTPLLREPSQFVPEKDHSDDSISIKLSADEPEDDSEKEIESFSTEITQEESTFAPGGVPSTDGEQEVATGDKDNIENTQEPSQGSDQALSATIFPLSLDGMQRVTAEDSDVLGTSSMVRDRMPSCNNASRELTSNIATVAYRYSTTEIEEIGSPGKDYMSSQSSQLNNLNSVAGGTSSSVSDIGDNELAFQRQLKKLVKNLQANLIEVQRAAVAELRLILKNDSGSRITITNYGAIRPLVEMLHSCDLTIQENAVTTLLNLSLYENNHKAIPAAGAINSLLHVLKTGSPQARENAAATLYSISAVEENKKKIAQSGGIPPLIDLLVNGSTRGKKDAATALFKLSTCHENKAQIVRAGAAKPLIEAMDPAAGMVNKAVAALYNLSTIGEGRVAISNEGGISRLVEVVELGSQRAKENAAAALGQFCSNSNRFRSIVLQEGAIPPLVALSKSGTSLAKEKAELLEINPNCSIQYSCHQFVFSTPYKKRGKNLFKTKNSSIKLGIIHPCQSSLSGPTVETNLGVIDPFPQYFNFAHDHKPIWPNNLQPHSIL